MNEISQIRKMLALIIVINTSNSPGLRQRAREELKTRYLQWESPDSSDVREVLEGFQKEIDHD